MILERVEGGYMGPGIRICGAGIHEFFDVDDSDKIELLTYKIRRDKTYECKLVPRKLGDFFRIIIGGYERMVFYDLYEELYKKHGYDIFYLGINICD